MNKWDPLKCACNAAEDTYDDDNEYQYVKEDISQTIMPGEKIDLFCTQKGGWSEATVKETRKVEGKDDDSMEAFCHYLVSSCTSLFFDHRLRACFRFESPDYSLSECLASAGCTDVTCSHSTGWLNRLTEIISLISTYSGAQN